MYHSQAVRTQGVQAIAGSRRRKVVGRIGGIVLCGLVVSVGWGAADTPAPVGLRGIVPNGAPTELVEAISQLPENWGTWGNSLSEDLNSLYGEGPLDVAAQRDLLAKLGTKVKTAKKAIGDKAYIAIRDVLTTIHDGLERRVEVLSAVLDTLELDPAAAKAASLKAASAQVVQASMVLEGFLKTIPNGEGWAKYFKADKLPAAITGGPTPETLALVKDVQARFGDKSKLGDEKAQLFLKAPPFTALQAAVNAYANAVGRESATLSPEDLRKQLGELVASLEQYEATASVTASAAARKAFAELRKSAPDGAGRLAPAMQKNYMNYNLHIVASEALLNRLVSEKHNESGAVVDQVMGANVSGSQSTQSVVGLDLLPSANGAKFDITVNGTITSNTAGVTSQATIYTSGYHTFRAAKEVEFDGMRFKTKPATIAVNANNTTTGAETGMFLFRGMANNIAMNEANARRPQSEAHARARIQEQVLPKFNSKVDEEFARANGEMRTKLVEPLQQMNLFPDAISYRTTDSQLLVDSRLMKEGELGGSMPLPITSAGLNLQIHESLINNSIDTMDIAGKTMTDAELKAMLEDRFSKLLGREFKLATPSAEEKSGDDAEKGPKALIFDKDDPIRIRFADDRIYVTIRAGFKREDKDDIPVQIVTVTLSVSVDEKNVVVTRENVTVTAANPPANAAEQVALAGVVRKKIESTMPQRNLSRTFRLKRKDGKVDTTVTKIKALDGWFSLSAR